MDSILKPLEDFAHEARIYCGLMEGPMDDMEDWLQQVLQSVSMLYALAQRFPEPEDENEDDDETSFEEFQERYAVSRGAWKSLFDKVGELLGDKKFYWEIFDPSESIYEEQEPLAGDLADDLADIYTHIKPGLRAWEAGKKEDLSEILQNWYETLFTCHWGVHAVSAMRLLHPLCFRRGIQANSRDDTDR